MRGAAAFTLALLLGAEAGAREKFEPPDGKTLLIIGQDVEAAEAYLEAVETPPAGYMGYTGLHEAEGLLDSFDGGGGQQFADRLLHGKPDAVFQIGLYMKDIVEAVAAGEQDAVIDQLGDWIRQTRRPVFLRIGYEFDHPDNKYDPTLYKTAFRRVVDRLREQKVDNVAFVWHSCACAGTDLMKWYPGDDYVDWFGVSLFAQFPKTVERVAAISKEIEKPLMLAETSAWNARTEALKLAWFRRLFAFVEKNDVKAVCYINWDWDEIPAFATMGWGNARVDATPEVLEFWTGKTSDPRYLTGGPATLKAMGAR